MMMMMMMMMMDDMCVCVCVRARACVSECTNVFYDVIGRVHVSINGVAYNAAVECIITT